MPSSDQADNRPQLKAPARLIALSAARVVATTGLLLAAVESLATNVPLFLLLFAGAYVVMEHSAAREFGQRLTHTDALYFTVTVFSTVGFGDITPKAGLARLVVTGQMIADVVILGLAFKVIVGAVRSRRSGTGS